MGCEWVFPIGSEQFLRYRGLVLHLEEQDFSATPDMRYGYTRTNVVDALPNFNVSRGGSAVFSGAYYGDRYQFSWDLNLSPQKVGVLRAMIDIQKKVLGNYRIRDDRAAFGAVLPEIAIELVDKRQGMIEAVIPPGQRTRAKAGEIYTFGSVPEVASPEMLGYWAKFWIFVDISQDFKLDIQGRAISNVYAGRIAGKEVEPSSVASDE